MWQFHSVATEIPINRRGYGRDRSVNLELHRTTCIIFLHDNLCKNLGSIGERMDELAIGKRLKTLRTERGMTQEDLCTVLGVKDRQTISAVEIGSRHLSARELMAVVEKLGVSVEYFNDPFQLVGEGEFSWRCRSDVTQVLNQQETKARRWIAMYRTLATEVGHNRSYIRRTLALTTQSTRQDAMEAGEQFVEQFGLGDYPALRLHECVDHDLDILILTVETVEGVYSAACRLPDMETILLSRDVSEEQCNVDVAHQLLHILTWDAIPPKVIEIPQDFGGKRTLQVANSFVGALLIPVSTLKQYEPWLTENMSELANRVKSVAKEFHVTAEALSCRLVALGYLNQSAARSLNATFSKTEARRESTSWRSRLFSKRFAAILARALDNGVISARRAANMLGFTLEDLDDLFADHGLEHRIEL